MLRSKKPNHKPTPSHQSSKRTQHSTKKRLSTTIRTRRKLKQHHSLTPTTTAAPKRSLSTSPNDPTSNQTATTLDQFIATQPPFHTPERFELPSGDAQTTNQLRSSFLNYFKSQGHAHFPSASVVPTSDPTLLFTSAGMVPFKNVFLGLEQPPNGHTRVTTSQRCVRAGGKHNDLDNVGYTARHHTYFEMLGNFSFGDYFKEEAIFYAWDYLTNTLKLPKNKLMVSVFETDDEAAKLWSKISGFSESNATIRRMGAKDNFWQMGDTGPCGPCSEIYFDQGFEVDGEQFLEIWNLVFMQFNRQDNGDMLELTKKCVDTGMGLERLAAVMQGVRNNFDNDTFLTLVNKVGATSQFHNGWNLQNPHATHGSNTASTSQTTQHDQVSSSTTTTASSSSSSSLDLSSTPLTHHQRLTAMRVITDHLRAVLSMLYDGVQPGSSGRGYVLRRILRRACRYGLNLGYSAPFMYQHVDDVLKSMDEAIPGISQHTRQLKADLFREEKIFSSSLNKGIKIIKDYILKQHVDHDSVNTSGNTNDIEMIEIVDENGQKTIKKKFPNDLAFALYDAHGFPIDLTELCVQEYGWGLDTQAVEQLLEKRKSESREASKNLNLSSSDDGSGVLNQRIIDSVFDLWRTDGLSSEFVGYEKTFVPHARILDIRSLGTMKRKELRPEDPDQSLGKRKVILALDECPFYPTGGGQTNDTGSVTIRIPKTLLPQHLQDLTTHDFEVVHIDITNAVKDSSGRMILLSAEFDEHPLIDSDTILEMIKRNELSSTLGTNSLATIPFNRLFISASVDPDIRSQTSIHHTATHLLQASLQKVLGTDVNEVGDHHHHHHPHDQTDPTLGSSIKQAGSQVEQKYLRFDFGFPRPLTAAEISSVEDRINAIALRRIPVDIAEMSFDKAKELGAMALFGEKYGSEVRVVSIPEGKPGAGLLHRHQHKHNTTSTANHNHGNPTDKNFSVELCGGTHVANTSECYPFIVLSENGVSSGTRRIEAIAGPMASQYLAEQHRALKILKHDQLLKIHHLAPTDEIVANTIKLKLKADTALTRVKELEKEKLAMLFGGGGKGAGLNGGEMQDVNPLLGTFWHQPAGTQLSMVLPTISVAQNDQGQLNTRAPMVMLYNVDASLSGDYAIYRKFTEDLFNQQSAKYTKFMVTQPSTTHQSIAHVFIGAENGKALIYSNIPESCTKKGGDTSIISAHGGKHLTSNDVWKSISTILVKSKGGGNMTLAQGTFDFSSAKSPIDGAEAMMMTSNDSQTRMKGLSDALIPMLTDACKF